MVSYEDLPTARLPSIAWLDRNDFQGSKLSFFCPPPNKEPPMNSIWGDILPCGDRGIPLPPHGGPGRSGGLGGPMSYIGGQRGERWLPHERVPKCLRESLWRRKEWGGDWQFPNPGCGNLENRMQYQCKPLSSRASSPTFPTSGWWQRPKVPGSIQGGRGGRVDQNCPGRRFRGGQSGDQGGFGGDDEVLLGPKEGEAVNVENLKKCQVEPGQEPRNQPH